MKSVVLHSFPHPYKNDDVDTRQRIGGGTFKDKHNSFKVNSICPSFGDAGTYHTSLQRRLRRACASAQSHQFIC